MGMSVMQDVPTSWWWRCCGCQHTPGRRGPCSTLAGGVVGGGEGLVRVVRGSHVVLNNTGEGGFPVSRLPPHAT